MKQFKYLFAFSLPISILIAFYMRGLWVWFPVFLSFVVVPILDALIPLDTSNPSPDEEQKLRNQWWFKLLLYLVVPVHIYVLMVFFKEVNTVNSIELIGLLCSVGLSCGVLGINVGHELGHKNSKVDRFLAHLLLMTSLYMHFYIEHNYGHHKNVATPEDPATARKGETLYAFWYRSIIYSYKSAWQIQMKLVKNNFWSFKNNMLIGHIVQPLFLLLIGLYYGWAVMGYFIIAAVLGILLLETVNYIEHYGLMRNKSKKGYERTTFEHSWNSNHVMGRLVLFELSRHSDHHYKSVRPYQILRHHDKSPQLPAGYSTMVLFAIIPPLWFRVVDRLID